MNEMDAWFSPLAEALGGGRSPSPSEVKLLLELGKRAAEAGPQRFYALLTAFFVGRALGAAEAATPGLDAQAFLEQAVRAIEVRGT